MKDKKTLMIHHDGQIAVSTFTPLVLGKVELNKIVAEALGLSELDYKMYDAKVKVMIEFKTGQPISYWEED